MACLDGSQSQADGALGDFGVYDINISPSYFHFSYPSENLHSNISSSFLGAPCHPSQQYVAVSVINVHIGKIMLHSKCKRIPMVARVSLVDYWGHILLDSYVHPTHPVEDYRTFETGLSYFHTCNAPSFVDIQERVAKIIKNKILVGHRIWNFLSVLGLSHPALDTRDLALYRPLRKRLQGRSVIDLPILVHFFMGRRIGLDYEDSLEFSRAAMDLFRYCEDTFEGIIARGAWPCDLPPSAYAENYS